LGRTYDISPDGQRFLMIKETAQRSGPEDYLVVVENAFMQFQQRK
jgi:hypothetical protein